MAPTRSDSEGSKTLSLASGSSAGSSPEKNRRSGNLHRSVVEYSDAPKQPESGSLETQRKGPAPTSQLSTRTVSTAAAAESERKMSQTDQQA